MTDYNELAAKAVERYNTRSGYRFGAGCGLKAALVDMDGVLYDSMRNHSKAWFRLMSEQGIACTPDDFYRFEGMTGVATINTLLRRNSRPEISHDEAMALYQRKAGYFRAMGAPDVMPHTIDVLSRLSDNGVRCVLVTGSAQASVISRIDADYVGIFAADDRVTALDVVHGKPDPEPYLKGLEKAGAKPYNAIVIENAPLGAKAGHAAGVFTVAVTTGPIGADELYDAGADLVLPEVKILGTRNFVHPGYSVFFEPEDHGTMVLSTIGANQEGRLVGTAPGAQFYLLQSEDGNSEQMVEEDNWCAAVEYADSLGCDVISTSLGYYKFDEGINSHAYSDLDGQTAANSRAASRAASRGLLVLNSAGNEGDGTWKKIGFPADAKDIISVGATDSKGVNTRFSSLGYTADGRVKPDAMAMGGRSATIDEANLVRFVNGTSFSCPILAGAVTCLWQAFPNKRPTEIIKAVQQAGNFATHPNEVMGYGIPDLKKAYELLQK